MHLPGVWGTGASSPPSRADPAAPSPAIPALWSDPPAPELLRAPGTVWQSAGGSKCLSCGTPGEIGMRKQTGGNAAERVQEEMFDPASPIDQKMLEKTQSPLRV